MSGLDNRRMCICFCLLIISLIVIIFYEEIYEYGETIVYTFSAVIVTCVSALIITSKNKKVKEGKGIYGGDIEIKEIFKYNRVQVIEEINNLSSDNKDIENILNTYDVFNLEKRPLDTLSFEELELEKMDMFSNCRSLSPPESIRIKYMSKINKILSADDQIKNARNKASRWSLDERIVNPKFMKDKIDGEYLFVESNLLNPPDEKAVFSMARIINDLEDYNFIATDSSRRALKLLFSLLHFKHLPANCNEDYINRIPTSSKDCAYYIQTYNKILTLLEDILKRDSGILTSALNNVDTTDESIIFNYLNNFRIVECIKQTDNYDYTGAYDIKYGSANTTNRHITTTTRSTAVANRNTNAARNTNAVTSVNKAISKPRLTKEQEGYVKQLVEEEITRRKEEINLEIEKEREILTKKLDEEMEELFSEKKAKVQEDVDNAKTTLFDERAARLAKNMLAERKDEMMQEIIKEVEEEKTRREKEIEVQVKEKQLLLERQLKERLSDIAVESSSSTQQEMDEGDKVQVNYYGFRPSLDKSDKRMDSVLNKEEAARLKYLISKGKETDQAEKYEFACLSMRDGTSPSKTLKLNRTRNVIRRRPKAFLMPRDETGKDLYSASYGKLVARGYIKFAFGSKPPIATGMLNVWRIINDLHLRLIVVYINNKKKIARLTNLSSGKCLDRIYTIGEQIEKLEAEVKALKNASEDITIFSKTRDELARITKEKEDLERKYNYLIESDGKYSKIETLTNDLRKAKEELESANSDLEIAGKKKAQLVSKLSKKEIYVKKLNDKLKNLLVKEIKNNSDVIEIKAKTEELKRSQLKLKSIRDEYKRQTEDCEVVSARHLALLKKEKQINEQLLDENDKKEKEITELKDKITDLSQRLSMYIRSEEENKKIIDQARVTNTNIRKYQKSFRQMKEYIETAIVKYKEKVKKEEDSLKEKDKLIFLSIDKINKYIKEIGNDSAGLVAYIKQLKIKLSKDKQKDRQKIEQLEKVLEEVKSDLEPFFITNGAGFHYMKEYIRDLMDKRKSLLKDMNEVSVAGVIKHVKQGNIEFFEKKLNRFEYNENYAANRVSQYRELISIDNELSRQIEIIERFNQLVGVIFKDFEKINIGDYFKDQSVIDDIKGAKKSLLAEYEFLLSQYSSYISQYKDITETNKSLYAKNAILTEKMFEAEREVKNLKRAREKITDEVVVELDEELSRLSEKVKNFYTDNSKLLEDLKSAKTEITRLSRDNNTKLREVTELNNQIEKLKQDAIVQAQNTIDTSTKEFHKELDDIIDVLNLADKMKIPVEYGNVNLGNIKKKQLLIVDRIRELLISDDYVKKADEKIAQLIKENEDKSFVIKQRNKIIEELKKAIESGGGAVYNLAGENAPKDVIKEHLDKLAMNQKILSKSIDDIDDIRYRTISKLKQVEESSSNRKEVDRILKGLSSATAYLNVPYGAQSENAMWSLLRCISSKGYKRIFIHKFITSCFTAEGRQELLNAIRSQPNNLKKGILKVDNMFQLDNILTDDGVVLIKKVFEEIAPGSQTQYLQGYIKRYESGAMQIMPKESNKIESIEQSEESNEIEFVNEEGDKSMPPDDGDDSYDSDTPYDTDEESYNKEEPKTVNKEVDEDKYEVSKVTYEDSTEIDGFGEVEGGSDTIDLQSIFFILFAKAGLVDLSIDTNAISKKSSVNLVDYDNLINNLDFVVECIEDSINYLDGNHLSKLEKQIDSGTRHGRLIKDIVTESIKTKKENNTSANVDIDLILSFTKTFFDNPIFTEQEVINLLFSKDRETSEDMDVTDTNILTVVKEVQNYILVKRDIDMVQRKLVEYSNTIKDVERQVITTIPNMVNGLNDRLQNRISVLKKIAFIEDSDRFDRLVDELEIEERKRNPSAQTVERYKKQVDQQWKGFNKAVTEFKQSREYQRYKKYSGNGNGMSDMEITTAVSVQKIIEIIEDFRNKTKFLEKAERDYNKLEKGFARLDEEKAALYSRFYSTVSEITKNINNHSEEIYTNVKKLEEILAVSKQKSKEMESLKARIKVLEYEKENKESNGIKDSKQMLSMENTINAYKLNMEEITSEVDKVLAEVKNIVADTTTVTSRTTNLNKSIDKYTDDIKSVENKIIDIQSTANDNAESKKRVEDLLKEKFELEAMRAEDISEYNKCRIELSNNDKRQKSMEDAISKSVEQLSYITTIVDKIKEETAIIKEREQSRVNEINKIVDEKDKLQSNARDLTKIINTNNEIVIQLISIIQQLQKKSINILSSEDVDKRVSHIVKEAVNYFTKYDGSVKGISSMIDEIEKRWQTGLSTLDEYVERNKKLEDEVRRLTLELEAASNIESRKTSSELEDARNQLSAFNTILNIFVENKNSSDIEIIRQVKDKSGTIITASSLASYLEVKRAKSLEIIQMFEKILSGWGGLKEVIDKNNFGDKIKAIILLYQEYKNKVDELMKQKVKGDEEAAKKSTELENSLMNREELESKIRKLEEDIKSMTTIHIESEDAISNSIISKDKEILYLKQVLEVMNKAVKDSMGNTSNLAINITDIIQNSNTVRENLDKNAKTIEEVYPAILSAIESIKNRIKESVSKDYEKNKLDYEKLIHAQYKEKIEEVRVKLEDYKTQLATYDFIDKGLDSVRDYIKISINGKKSELEKRVLQLTAVLREEIANKNQLIEKNRSLLSINNISVDIVSKLKDNIKACSKNITSIVISLDEIVSYAADIRSKYDQALQDLINERKDKNEAVAEYNKSLEILLNLKESLEELYEKHKKDTASNIKQNSSILVSIRMLDTKLSDYKELVNKSLESIDSLNRQAVLSVESIYKSISAVKMLAEVTNSSLDKMKEKLAMNLQKDIDTVIELSNSKNNNLIDFIDKNIIKEIERATTKNMLSQIKVSNIENILDRMSSKFKGLNNKSVVVQKVPEVKYVTVYEEIYVPVPTAESSQKVIKKIKTDEDIKYEKFIKSIKQS